MTRRKAYVRKWRDKGWRGCLQLWRPVRPSKDEITRSGKWTSHFAPVVLLEKYRNHVMKK